MAKRTLPQKLHKKFSELNEAGDIKGIGQLIKENNIDINATFYRLEKGSKDGKYLIHEIIEKPKNIIEKLDYFAENGVDLNVEYMKGTPIHWICTTKFHIPAFEKLLQLGVKLDSFDRNGQTLLSKFTQQYTDTYRQENEQELNYVKKEDKKYKLELQFIKLLLQHSADQTQKNKYETSALDWLTHRKGTGEWNKHHSILEKLFE